MQIINLIMFGIVSVLALIKLYELTIEKVKRNDQANLANNSIMILQFMAEYLHKTKNKKDVYEEAPIEMYEFISVTFEDWKQSKKKHLKD